ncbi:hypothetical protein H2200_002537 [Cladophialophora chaetospira]|uniref:Heterokaryon incompatibility domain-containing protein n=1 Tax=Cladophialophora chaetospira TaxID=386627 RepID=A0AA38XJ57_9EURO|nr:hypothetical protein H2200_002537 [Cladophialophora chaetospira]
MWLLDTSSLRLKYFTAASKIKYAILSHTWDDEEITFQDITRIETGDVRRTTSSGFRKIKHACKIAKSQNLGWCWIDTCCIDKSSSAELSEAINSMFAWYKGSTVCYVYLNDFEPSQLMEACPSNATLPSAHIQSQFYKCRWFFRGWTLQELIAPRRVEFYNKYWQHLGDKSSEVLRQLLFPMTRIDPEILEDSSLLPRLPAARKMSWASQRVTTREEDTAYCLMGIFDVNMPLLYGEGRKAFQRLQEQIFVQTSDLSLFAWDMDEDPVLAMQGQGSGFFANGPKLFRKCSTLKHDSSRRRLNKHCKIDDNSIEVEILTSKEWWQKEGSHLLDLNCARMAGSASSPLWLALRLHGSGAVIARDPVWVVQASVSRAEWYRDATIARVRLSKHPPNDAARDTLHFNETIAIKFQHIDPRFGKLKVKEGLPATHWSDSLSGPLQGRLYDSRPDLSSIAVLPFTFLFNTATLPAQLALVVIPKQVPGGGAAALCGIFQIDEDSDRYSARITEAAHRNYSGRSLREDDSVLEEILDELCVSCGNAWGEISPSTLPQSARLLEHWGNRTHRFYILSEDEIRNSGEAQYSGVRLFMIGYECYSWDRSAKAAIPSKARSTDKNLISLEVERRRQHTVPRLKALPAPASNGKGSEKLIRGIPDQPEI